MHFLAFLLYTATIIAALPSKDSSPGANIQISLEEQGSNDQNSTPQPRPEKEPSSGGKLEWQVAERPNGNPPGQYLEMTAADEGSDKDYELRIFVQPFLGIPSAAPSDMT
ncbi:MAG: hypothetical protein Q9169_003412 [Polycauliona sp. 2 TL-2023]